MAASATFKPTNDGPCTPSTHTCPCTRPREHEVVATATRPAQRRHAHGGAGLACCSRPRCVADHLRHITAALERSDHDATHTVSMQVGERGRAFDRRSRAHLERLSSLLLQPPIYSTCGGRQFQGKPLPLLTRPHATSARDVVSTLLRVCGSGQRDAAKRPACTLLRAPRLRKPWGDGTKAAHHYQPAARSA